MENKEQQVQKILSEFSVTPNPEWVVNTRNNLIDQINAEKFSAKFNFLDSLRMKTKTFSIVALASIIALAGIGTTVHAAVTSKPGDFLFGLNKAIENVQRGTTSNDNAKLELEKQILEKRLNDLNELIQTKDAAKIALAQQELAEQQGKVNEVENHNRGKGSEDSNPTSFPKTEDSNEHNSGTEDSGRVENEQQNETEQEQEHNSTTNSTTNETSGSGSSSNEQEKENSTDSNKGSSGSGSDSNKTGKDD